MGRGTCDAHRCTSHAILAIRRDLVVESRLLFTPAAKRGIEERGYAKLCSLCSAQAGVVQLLLSDVVAGSGR